tara:strand:- start:1 stop:240 length:240 start_codon:yes stop_codon:yes gene_type:complete
MTTYNNNNIKALLSLFGKRKTKYRTVKNLIIRGAKLGIEEKEVLNSVNLLLDLKVLKEIVINTGDGWNTRGTCKALVIS